MTLFKSQADMRKFGNKPPVQKGQITTVKKDSEARSRVLALCQSE